MNRFPFLLARWEARHALSRVGVFMLSISLGVAALVSVRSFRADMTRSIAREAQVLMGADVRLSGRRPLEGAPAALVDSLETAGHQTARVVTTPSMVLAPATGSVRLTQVRAVEGGWPFYGRVRTRPAGLWPDGTGEGDILVDPAILTRFGVETGDSLQVGEVRFRIRGTVEELPTELGFQAAAGPRIFLDPAQLDASGILTFGSLARYQTFLRMPERGDQDRLETAWADRLADARVDWDTAREEASDLTDAVGFLGRYLGLVGLAALLLGGIGVGSAIHVFVRERLTEVAVLRCLGARQGPVFGAYLLQAAGLGLAGSAVGAVAGVGLQFLLPTLLGGTLPVAVEPALAPASVLGGMAAGVWVSLAFALLPLLGIRDAPPLRALRHSLEPAASPRDPWRMATVLLVAASVLGLAVLEAPSTREGLAFAGALAIVVALLAGTGWLLARAARRWTPVRAPYPLRQGLSNLFRPGNQTVAVTLALGLGAFVVGTVLLVQRNLARELALEEDRGQPNLLLFDIQGDQLDPILELLPAGAGAEATPLITSRIVAVNGRTPSQLRTLPYERQPAAWALRRTYRHTFRDTLTDAETLVEGRWWDAPAGEGGETEGASGTEAEGEPSPARISMEEELARELRVGVGDRITWEVSGIRLESRITSVRQVDWGQFQTNFFVVFEPASLRDAPATWVVLASVPDADVRAGVQRDLLDRFPNVSALDLTRVREVLAGILSRVAQGVAFMALFAALAGTLVLAGALAASRHQRLVEGALLRTLGARRGQVLSVLLSEYLALGMLGALTGLVLAVVASALLVRLGFGIPWRGDAGVVLGIWAGVSVLTVVTGLLGSRDLLRRPPLPVLRGD